MRKLNMILTGALCAAALFPAVESQAVGWPANHQGVMLQGFYWDSYKGSNTTKWSDLTAKADELSQYFNLIWVPNCSKASGENGGGNGYMPIYWFSHHSCAFGNETQLKTMISTFKEKGTYFIEDVVINHRVGVSDWADFPAETWNGTTYQLKSTDVCSTDEWSGGPKGGYDTGEDFNGARDLDHTSSNVQTNCKAYCKYLLSELGFAGFRLDMVKGYSGYYTKIYNQYARPTYCVGEYWDGSYDAVAAWIEATGRESAAFDFPFKYAVNKCFNGGGNNYNELVWAANGTTNQPAGLIHYGYPQLAVTFIDNHDTYRDDNNKMNGDVLQANAFMLASPGTPCVFWPHYTSYKSQIQAMINARNGVGITNTSAVTVLEVSSSCYVAEITGTKGKLWIKLGSSSRTPGSGYTKKASGNKYEIWTTAEGGTGGGGGGTVSGSAPSSLYVIGEVNGNAWACDKGVAMTKSGNKFSTTINVTVPATATGAYFSFAANLGSSWDELNAAGNRYAPVVDSEITESAGASFSEVSDGNSAKAFYITTSGTYTLTADFDKMMAYIGEGSGGGDTPTPTPDPSTGGDVNIYFDNTVGWTTPYIHYWGGAESTWPGVAMTKVDGNIWKYVCPEGTTGCLFNAGDGDASKTEDFTAINNHVYTTSGDQGEYSGAGGGGGGDTPTPTPTTGDYYLIGNLSAESALAWVPGSQVAMTQEGTNYTLVQEIVDAGAGLGYYSIVTSNAASWDGDDATPGINSSDRYGAPDDDTATTLGTPMPVTCYVAGQNASSASSWSVPAGTYKFLFNPSALTLTVTEASGVSEILGDAAAAPIWFNLQGQRVSAPTPGIYIRVVGPKAEKVLVK